MALSLRQRTALLRRTGTSPEGLRRFKARIRALEAGSKDCPFLGFLDAAERRVGCLIHPARLAGRELRRYGKYGSRTCAGTWCHFADTLPGLDQAARRLFLLLAADADWYDYSRLLSRFVSYRQSVGLFAILCDYTRPVFERLLAFRPSPRGFQRAYLRLVEEAAQAVGRTLGSHRGRVIAGVSFSHWRLFGLRFFGEAARSAGAARLLDELVENASGRFALE